MTDLSTLITMLEKAEAGSRELDRDIFVAFFCRPVPPEGYEWPGTPWARVMPSDRMWIRTSDGIPTDGTLAPAYSTSIDAAVALVAEKLPGWTIASLGQDDGKRWHAELRKGYRTSYSTVALAGSPTPALALILALLKAMEGRDKHGI